MGRKFFDVHSWASRLFERSTVSMDMAVTPPRPIRVLVAEDVAVNRELIRLFLEPRGYAVDTVCDGVEAIKAITQVHYDMVIMDMQMPSMDGMEATRTIRDMGGDYAAIPIIGLSANIIPDQVELCLAAGMSAHVSKPFSPETLCEVMDHWLGPLAKPGNEVLTNFVSEAGWTSVRGLLDMLYAQIVAFEKCPPDDFQALGRQAHALRSAAGALGFASVETACLALETACQTSLVPAPILSAAQKAAEHAKHQIIRELARAA